MATGTFKPTKKIDQFPLVTDLQLRKYFISFADSLSEKRRREIVATYENPQLRSLYTAYRNINDLRKGWTKRKTLREIVRVPMTVYHFLNDYFEPQYGKKWLTNRKVLRHELLRPWWIVSKI